ncbi:MAG: endopeptidase La [Acidobacteriota bacterium]
MSARLVDEKVLEPGPPATPAGPGELAIVPLRNTVLFPGVVMPLHIGRPASLKAIEDAVRNEVPLGILAQRDSTNDTPGPSDLYAIGTVADVLRILVSPEGTPVVLMRGRERFRILEALKTEPFLSARVERLKDPRPDSQELEARLVNLRKLWGKLLEVMPQPVPELAAAVEGLDEPGLVVDVIASTLEVPFAEKQQLLETLDMDVRVRAVTEKLSRQIEVLELSKKIDTDTKGSLEKSQKEFFLRQQLKAIQKELGEDDPRAGEAKELRERIEAAKMPVEVEKQALSELARLERSPEASAEGSMLRTYVEWLCDVPWSVASEERIDVAAARDQLDLDHHDLEKVKKRIIELLAVRKLKPSGRSPILCFVGPPGVGKTSLGQSIAKATNRRFVRQSLGGVHDESEIRGHRRTYIGALPGRIIQGMKKAGTRNPVFMLDEIDKLNASLQGDPSAALLEVLDPEQNGSFEDHYLGVPFDLSQVLFVATANVLDTIPGPLRDRMEILELPGYSEEDKLVIARRYLVARQLDACGLTPAQATFEDDAILAIISGYTRESGVRQLEREIGGVCRAIATRFAEGHAQAVSVDRELVGRTLGSPKFRSEVALRTSLPGVATGLAWTPFGGDILFVEVTRTPGRGGLLLTGQLGDVMKESAQAAFSLVKARATKLGIDPEKIRGSDLHIHLPAGAIPKDGPSAGITLFIALVSLLTGRRVRHDLAMTGEISLRGLVLPVGGIKEKVLAARRAGIKTVILPELNRRDVEEIPESARQGLELVHVATVDDVLDVAFVRGARARGTRRKRSARRTPEATPAAV